MAQLFDKAALANMTAEEKAQALSEALNELAASGVSAKDLTEAAKQRREAEAEEAKRSSEEALRAYESAKADLEKRVNDVIVRWIAKAEIGTADLLVSGIVVRDGKLVEPVSLKPRPKSRPQSIGPAAARGTGERFTAKVGTVRSYTLPNGRAFKSGTDVMTALSLPMPPRESAPDALRKIAGIESGPAFGRRRTDPSNDRRRALGHGRCRNSIGHVRRNRRPIEER